MIFRALAALIFALVLTACTSRPVRQATPALWEVQGANGEQGWVFGTIHVLPDGLDWRTPALDSALARADRLVLEIDPDALEPAKARREFLRLGSTPGLPPLAARVRPDLRDALAQFVDEANVDLTQTALLEDWAAALSFAQAQAAAQGMSADRGVEAALIDCAAGRPVEALETVAGQFTLFDALPSSAQSVLLEAVIEEGLNPAGGKRLLNAWASGDVAALEVEARAGMLANPTLRQELLLKRNAAWTERIDGMLRSGQRAFIAVGAAHVAGPEGLPALLAAKGWKVRRVQ